MANRNIPGRTPQKPTRELMVQRGLDLQLRAARAKNYLFWGCFHAAIFGILLFDMHSKCAILFPKWPIPSLLLTLFVGLSFVNCTGRYLYFILTRTPVEGTEQQRLLLSFASSDPNFVLTPPKSIGAAKEEDEGHNNANVTMLSWHSSFNNSYGRLTPHRFSPNHNNLSSQPYQDNSGHWDDSRVDLNNSSNMSFGGNSASGVGSILGSRHRYGPSFVSAYKRVNERDLIMEESELKKYLKENSLIDTSDATEDAVNSYQRTQLRSFWTYYNYAANMLRTSLYQLAPTTGPDAPSKQLNADGLLWDLVESNSENIKNIPTEKLSSYLAKLRHWISTTILGRLVHEIESLDETFRNRGLVDMQIGSIALERLKQTAANQQFVNSVPMLPLVLPFLDMTNNQEYLVQRIKDLAKGSCMSEYRWNSGSTYHGLKWNDLLPTDSAILFHLFCVYMDSQLLPLPQGGGRPFYSRYVIVVKEKRPLKELIESVQNRANCAILCTNPMRPKFNFISENKIHKCAYDRNNLFYVIIEFLLYMKKHQNSCLEGVNMGKSGINIMCIVED